MDLSDLEEEVRAMRGKFHNLSNEVHRLMADADADRRMHAVNVPAFSEALQRIARLEEVVKDFQMMKAAVGGAVLSALAALAVALLKGG